MKNLSAKKKLILVLLIVLVIGLVFLMLLANKTPPPPTTPAIPSPTPYSKFQIKSPVIPVREIKLPPLVLDTKLEIPALPATLPVYSASLVTIDINSTISQLIKYLKLDAKPASSQTWSNPEKNRFLYLKSKQTIIIYGVDSLADPSAFLGSSPPDVKNAINTARNFISTLPQLVNYTVNSEKITFLSIKKGSQEFYPTTQSKANLIQIPFTQFVNNTPVYNTSTNTSYASVVIGQRNQIVKFSFSTQVFDINLTSPKEYFTITAEDFNSHINSREVDLIGIPLEDIHKDLSSIYIKSVTVKYLFHSESRQLIPYYYLEGYFLSTQNNEQVDVTLVLPAVNI